MYKRQIFFQAREACNPYYDALPAIVQEYMDKVNAKIVTDYNLFNYYGAADAEHVIIAMGLSLIHIYGGDRTCKVPDHDPLQGRRENFPALW